MCGEDNGESFLLVENVLLLFQLSIASSGAGIEKGG